MCRPRGAKQFNETTFLSGASVHATFVQPPVPATSEVKRCTASMDVAGIAHVLDGPGILANFHAGGSHPVVEPWVVEEALGDSAVRVVQRTLIVRFAHHPALICRRETCVEPPLVPLSRLLRKFPPDGRFVSVYGPFACHVDALSIRHVAPDVVLGEVGPDPVVELLE
eukprot:6517453-Pyramimonas_sp.AAC.1